MVCRGTVAENLEERAIERLHQAAGVWVEVSNDHDTPFEVRIVGVNGDWPTVKAPELPCDCLRRPGVETLALQVPARTTYRVLLQLLNREVLDVTLSMGETEARQEVVLGQLPASWERTVRGWDATDERPRTGVRFHRRGPEVPGFLPSAGLRDRLTALGYLE